MAAMIPPAPAALLQKLRTATAQALAATETPPSPCISVCRMDTAQQYCVGCLRTLDELCAWGTADATTQRLIWERVRQRSQNTASQA